MNTQSSTGVRDEPRPHTPLVSVIIPVYNRQEVLLDALESVKQQTYEDYELIVVDDASTEDLHTIVMQVAPNARYIRHKINSGAGAARNTGIRAARGKYIACLDSDDMWLPEKLEVQLAYLEQHPEVGLVGAAAIYVDETGTFLSGPHSGPPEVTHEMLCVRVTLPGSGANEMIPRHVFDRVGLFNEALRRAQDWEMWLRISKVFPVRVLAMPLLKRRAHRTARHAVNERVIRECRAQVAALVDDPKLRRANLSLTEYRMFQNHWMDGNYRAGLKALLASVRIHPGRIPHGTRRLIPTLDLVMPRLMATARKATRLKA